MKKNSDRYCQPNSKNHYSHNKPSSCFFSFLKCKFFSDILSQMRNFISVFSAKEMFLITVMNFIGVIPYYLTGSTLMLWFRDIGFSFGSIGLVAILNTPHAVKFLWSHLFESVELPFLSRKIGLRRSWLVLSQLIIILLILWLSFIDPVQNIVLFCTLVFVCNIFVASHNILCLAIQMEIIPRDTWGPSEAMNVLGFRMGMIFASAGSLYLSQFVQWNLIYRWISILIIVGVFITAFMKLDNLICKPFVKYNGSFVKHFKCSIGVPMKEFFKLPGVGTLLVFMVLYSLYDHLLSSMHKIFHLSIGFSKAQVAFVDNTFGMFMTLLGGFLAGLSIKKYGSVKVIQFGSFLGFFVGLCLLLQNYVGVNLSVLYFTVAVQEIVHGFTMTGFFTYQMNCCSMKFAVSQLSLIKALDALGKYTFGSISGFLVDMLGWNGFFIVICFASLPAVIIMNVGKIRNAIYGISNIRELN